MNSIKNSDLENEEPANNAINRKNLLNEDIEMTNEGVSTEPKRPMSSINRPMLMSRIESAKPSQNKFNYRELTKTSMSDVVLENNK